MGKGQKRVSKQGQVPEPGKRVRLPPEHSDRVVWRFSRYRDSHPKVGWDNASAAELQQLRRKLREVEERGGGPSLIDGSTVELIKVRTLDKQRQSLLRSAFNDEDLPAHLLRIKVTGKCRIWVSRSSNCLEFLWWDPEHWVTPFGD